VILAAGAIRDVALGVVLTALVQSVLGGIGLAAAGVPLPGLLTALMFLLAIAQIGPAPVLIGAVVWVYATSDSAWVPAVLLVWSIGVGAMDNVLRPILIRRGGNLPLLIVFAGVIGGLLGFGLAGIFVGPVVLAVAYTLLKAWVSEEPAGEQIPVAGAPLPSKLSRE
jgi:predicted PurR-regulated permease PerM